MEERGTKSREQTRRKEIFVEEIVRRMSLEGRNRAPLSVLFEAASSAGYGKIVRKDVEDVMFWPHFHRIVASRFGWKFVDRIIGENPPPVLASSPNAAANMAAFLYILAWKTPHWWRDMRRDYIRGIMSYASRHSDDLPDLGGDAVMRSNGRFRALVDVLGRDYVASLFGVDGREMDNLLNGKRVGASVAVRAALLSCLLMPERRSAEYMIMVACHETRTKTAATLDDGGEDTIGEEEGSKGGGDDDHLEGSGS